MFNFVKKAISSMVDGNVVHPRSNWHGLNIPRTNFDYQKEVGTGLGSNVIMSPVQWVMRTFPESCVKLDKLDAKGNPERILKHPFLSLINNPNDFYTYEALIMATLLSWSTAGNSYWYKVRNVAGQVIQLWYLPHWMVTPKGSDYDLTVFIDHYEYNPAGTPFKIPVEDIIHYRFGLDPENVREGLSPLGAVLREVYTDDEASRYSSAILRNMGIPGTIISPAKEEVSLSDDEAKSIKEKYRQSFSGDRRGDTMIMSTPVKIETFGFNTKQMALPDVRDISEERVCAALGIPAAVVGFGSGLQQTKVGATMTALIGLAWKGNIIPAQRVFGQTLQNKLLQDFDTDENLQVGYNNSNVAALQEDKDKKVKRVGKGVQEGWAMVSDAREAEGLAVDDSHKVFLRPFSMVEET